MAKNLTINGVTYNGVESLDIPTDDGKRAKYSDTSGDTVTPETLGKGVTAHDKTGAPIVGTMESGGGFTPPDSEYLDPNEVYRTTRPSDWLPMPTPGDYECYCLGHILKGLKGHFVATITFTGTCTVEYGTVVNGVFVARESFTPTSNTLFHKELEYNNYSDELADGTRQYMVRIYGTNIEKINFRRASITLPRTHVVDIISGIYCNFIAGDYNQHRSSLDTLRYLRFVGNGGPRGLSGQFVGGCSSLMSVSMERDVPNYMGHWGYGNYAFFDCANLIAISDIGFSEITDATHMFEYCRFPQIKTNAKLTSMDSTFLRSRLKKFDKSTFDTANTSNMYACFGQCGSLVEVTGLDISSLTTTTNMFYYCWNLSRLVLAGDTTPGGYTIDLQYATLEHDALVEMIASLPTATNAATITITNNPGASELTADEIAVATAKNWTITI